MAATPAFWAGEGCATFVFVEEMLILAYKYVT